ncbi:VOC family protein [Goodfellowiella coeruleoviolacea]|uniref:4a-hydroxytetrahydrobiopterin dehydratase n=1 Tax=Goodfellowiella coeruleoviolacea TaxID=334858 RepID=A0AAE3GL62_9PSEU|nr:VOC family protein [Goodfellowiella coeruleoviolacea]MCP2169424.1 4a-hydroxytetrahydrobiopterin dehydratase [Goodfellowiella coeruleoviolacea]
MDSVQRWSRQQISAAVSDLGWRYVLGALCTSVRTASLAQAAELAGHLTRALGQDAEGRLRLDLRPDRVLLTVPPPTAEGPTPDEVDLARRIAALAADRGTRLDPGVGTDTRAVQLVEIAVDALDIARIRPFWKAVLGYVDEAGASGPEDPLIDPLGQHPAVWFQQMTEPRPQRNRIHLDVSVPHDEAEQRVAAALAAGGTLRSADRAPAFWVLADAEGNEVCVTTWQGRD